MIDTISQLISQYGYFAIGIGCLFEGEASILLGILAARHDMLTFEGVIITAILATLIGDNACFHIGRHMGRPALNTRPGWRAKAERVERLIHRYGTPVMIGFRFLYGVRYITPFVLGSLGISPWRFLLLDGIGTLLWANTVAFVGFFLASAVRQTLSHIQNAEVALLVAIGVLVGVAYGIYYLRRRRRQDRK